MTTFFGFVIRGGEHKVIVVLTGPRF